MKPGFHTVLLALLRRSNVSLYFNVCEEIMESSATQSSYLFFCFFTISYLKRWSEYREDLLACVSLFTPSWASEKGGLCSHIMASNEVEEGEALMSDEAGEGGCIWRWSSERLLFHLHFVSRRQPGTDPEPNPSYPSAPHLRLCLLVSPHVNRHSSSHLLLWRLSLRWRRKGEKQRATFCFKNI